MAEMENRWLSVEEIGKYLGVSSDTVYRWIDKHGMPAHRVGRLWKFKKNRSMLGSRLAVLQHTKIMRAK